VDELAKILGCENKASAVIEAVKALQGDEFSDACAAELVRIVVRNSREYEGALEEDLFWLLSSIWKGAEEWGTKKQKKMSRLGHMIIRSIDKNDPVIEAAKRNG
jgi:hypothetical protein